MGRGQSLHAERQTELQRFAEAGTSQTDIGQHFGLTRERARQLLNSAGLHDLWEHQHRIRRFGRDEVARRIEAWMTNATGKRQLLVEAALRWESLGYPPFMRDDYRRGFAHSEFCLSVRDLRLRVLMPVSFNHVGKGTSGHWHRVNPRSGSCYYVALSDGRRVALLPTDPPRTAYFRIMDGSHHNKDNFSNIPILRVWDEGLVVDDPVATLLRLYYAGRSTNREEWT